MIVILDAQNYKERGYMENVKTQKKLLSPKIDVVFQALFGEEGSERITKDFLQAMLKEEITEIDLSKNLILRRETLSDKSAILDVFVKINGKENCDIEMQMVKQEDIVERILYYWAKIYTRSIKKGENFSKLERTIVILITDKKIDKLEGLNYHTEWKIIETETYKKILTDKFQLNIIELEKINIENSPNKDKLIDWLSFIINPESERVVKKMEENEAIKEAKEKLEKMSEDEKMQRLAWWREKGELERNYLLYNGRQEGEKNKSIEITKEMLKKNMDIKLISEITKLSVEEIEKIRSDL